MQNKNIEKNTFKVVHTKFLPKHITNQKLGFDICTNEICTVGNVQNIFMNITFT